jgi:thiol-disulfide isomerase/thioredoxin
MSPRCRVVSWPAVLLGLVGMLSLLTGCVTEPAKEEVKLEVIKRQQYLEIIKVQRGKVVVVDVWANFCPPCKAEFPHFVEMARRYAGRGVVFLSVSVDDAEDHAAALKFLKSRGATFPNYLLDEPPAEWQHLFNIPGPPAAFVYDTNGNLAGRFDHKNQCTHKDVEALVQKLIPGT